MTREVERTGKTKGAARNALTTYLTERTTPAADAITGESLVRDVAAVWLAERSTGARPLSITTRRRYREVIHDHIAPAVGSLRVREATVTRLDRFVKNVTADVGPATAKLCTSILSGVMGLAVRHGAAATNPVRDIAKVHVDSKPVRAMTFEQVSTARSAVAAYVAGEPIIPGERVLRGRSRADDLLDIVDVMLATGIRIGEVLAIRWSDVDLEAGTVTVCGTIIRDDTVTPSRMARQPFTKGKKEQTYLLPAFGVEAFMRRRVAMTHGNVEDLVFPSQAGTVREPGNVRTTLGRILDKVDLGWVRPHTFRKTVATVIEREADLRTASAQLGHGSEAVTRRHYVERATVGPDTRHITARFVPASSND
ncbi:tyrosine-type recombinase/integrase [Nocardioides sp. STR2]|uniref:Tyrosine-type recombinase/integrase n=1 Tax=Nocardioides pini TaxID=2975053 RepID=A0ABT4CCR6_9ACTN|nr:tyrosine-type recombinase/integrase [Nocardioides pini]MCY4726739.1 tyrosine-type recombinase/integrase [Nocardioides pini]